MSATFRDVGSLEIVKTVDRLLFDRPAVVGDGGNSGFQALNLAAQMGASRIVFVGFDMNLENGVHWHGPHGRGLNNPNERNFVRWRRVLDASKPTLDALGVRAVVVGERSSLTAFDKVRTVREALA